jgi:purine-binding chemotaxis protein CheW
MPRSRPNRRGGMDWSDLRRRVDEAGRAVSGESAVSPERVAVLLAERARALARPLVEAGPAEAPGLMSFSVAGETYAVELGSVLEVSRVRQLAAMPRSEPWVAGLAGWRGDLVLVVDLRAMLGAPDAGSGGRSVLIVLGESRPVLGLLADAPGDLLSIPGTDLKPPPAGIAGRSYILGMTADAVLVLDVNRIFATVELEPA